MAIDMGSNDQIFSGVAPYTGTFQDYIGREKEFAALRKGFKNGNQLGLILGSAGVGKSSLARVFMSTALDLFPGGVAYQYGIFGESILDKINDAPRRRSLLVIDEIQMLGYDTTELIDKYIMRYKALNFLLVGQVAPTFRTRRQFSVVLKDFSEEEVLVLLQSRLSAVDRDLAHELYSRLGGNPAAVLESANAIYRGEFTWEELLAGIRNFSYSGLLGPDGRPLRRGSSQHSRIVLEVSKANEDLFALLEDDPDRWRQLPPRKFEEIVAQLLEKQGYEVTLTPASGDGGFDMYAAQKEGLGEFLFLVECKRYTPPNKVGVEVVRSLQGVLSEQRATGAAIVTTSFFTSGAEDYQKKFQHQLKLHDYIALQRWLTSIRREYTDKLTPNTGHARDGYRRP